MIKLNKSKLIEYMSEKGFRYFEGCYSNDIFTIEFRPKLMDRDLYLSINCDSVIQLMTSNIDLPNNDEDNVMSTECKNENDLYTALDIIFA